MKGSRLRKYLAKNTGKTVLLTSKKDIQKNSDERIDPDYPASSQEEMINPRTTNQKKLAGVKKKEPDIIIMDMPEVKDIPGQENINPPHMREMSDVTISSADEEGEGLLDDINKEDSADDVIDRNSNVTRDERKLLSKADRLQTEEQIDRKKLSLDNTDGADPLNEEGDPSDMGKDLDIPGTELDDRDEATGEEDEENNSYSRPD